MVVGCDRRLHGFALAAQWSDHKKQRTISHTLQTSMSRTISPSPLALVSWLILLNGLSRRLVLGHAKVPYPVLGMGEDVIRIEIVMAPIEITSYESIDTVALKRRGRKLRPKGQEVVEKVPPATPNYRGKLSHASLALPITHFGLIVAYLSARCRSRCRPLISLMISLMA
jgi:hypothetical protein